MNLSLGFFLSPRAAGLIRLAPSPVTTEGGSTITVTSLSALLDLTDATVTVDGDPVTTTPIDASSFSFVTDAHVAGDVAVVITPTTGPAMTLYLAYQAPVVLTSLTTPTSTLGGATITVLCTNAANVTGVTVNGAARTVTSVDGTHFSFVAPSLVVGNYDVIAQTAIGDSNTITITTQAPVVLTSTSPSPLAPAGGEVVTVLCTNAANVTACTVNGVTRARTAIDATHFSFVMPALVEGVYDLIAQTEIGNSNTITVETDDDAVVLTSLDNSAYSTAGGTTVTVLCSNAANVTGVTADGVARTVTPIDGTHFSFVAAPHAVGSVNVIAQTALGDSNAIALVYQAPVVLTSLSPDPTNSAGGDVITVLCTNAANVTACTVNGSTRAVTAIDGTHFSFVMPALTAGATYDVIAQTAIGDSNTITITTAAAFSPLSIGTPILWLRADLGVTTSSGEVTGWADQSGIGDSGRDFAPFGADKPAYNASDAAYNNQATIGTFNKAGSANNCELKSSTWNATYSTFTVIVVGHTVGDANPRAFTRKSNFNSAELRVSGTTPAAVSSLFTSFNSGVAASTSGPNMIAGLFSGAASKLYVNSFTSGVASGTQDANTLGDAAYYLGSRDEIATSVGVERIAEVIIYDGTISSGEMVQLRNYLNTRYGLSMP